MDPEKHPFKTTLKLSNGKEYRVLNSMLGLIRAEEEHGYDTGGVELDADKAEEKAQRAKGTRRMRNMLETVWIGILTFDPSVSFESLAMEVQTRADYEAVGRAFGHVIRYQLAKPDDPKKNEGEPIPSSFES